MRNIGTAFRLLLALSLGGVSNASLAQTDRLYVSEQSPVLKLIRKAKVSIDIEIYTLKDLKVVAALKRAISRGVRIRILQAPNPVDSCRVFGPKNGDRLCNKLRNFIQYVRDNGGRYVAFDERLCGKPDVNCFQHGKIMIMDSQIALISTGNFDASNLCDVVQAPTVCNRDYTLVTEDRAVVETLRKLFWRDMVGNPYDIQEILDQQPIQRVTVSPLSMRPLIKFIRSAKKTIQIENQYLKDPEFNQAIMDAARRGVKVFVMVASVCAFGPPRKGEINKWVQTYSAFDDAKVRTRVFTKSIPVGGMPGYLHAKVVLVDGERAWVGSVNGSTTSLTLNREFGVFSDEPEVIKTLATAFYEDYNSEGSETWKQSVQCKKDQI